MATTYEAIESTTLGSSGIVTFTNIPQTYTDLVLIFNGGITNDYWSIIARINSDTGANYGTSFLYAETSGAVSSGAGFGSTYMTIGGTGTGFRSNNLNNIVIANFMNYSNSSTRKTVLSRGDSGQTGVSAMTSVWNQTASITSISLLCSASNGGTTNLYANSTISLYGIKAA